jgi:F-type H+-transporting ATPase subunit b
VELNWSTFVLEIVNFLILVWILKHFLYKPVLAVIARRQAAINKSMSDAEAMQTDARQLQQKYSSRLQNWDEERQRAREALSRELETERSRQMAELQNELKQESEKARVAEQRRHEDVTRKLEETALLQSAGFASRLLQQAAGPDVEIRLAELLISGLNSLPEERIAHLRSSNEQAPHAILVVSVFPLESELRQQLEQALLKVSGPGFPLQYEQDASLLAGLRITIGAWVLGVNLHDELKGFMEFAPLLSDSDLLQ